MVFQPWQLLRLVLVQPFTPREPIPGAAVAVALDAVLQSARGVSFRPLRLRFPSLPPRTTPTRPSLPRMDPLSIRKRTKRPLWRRIRSIPSLVRYAFISVYVNNMQYLLTVQLELGCNHVCMQPEKGPLAGCPHSFSLPFFLALVITTSTLYYH